MPTYNRSNGTTRFQDRSAAKLSLPSAWLDQEMNDIYTILNAMTMVANASEWSAGTTPTFVNATQFTVVGDQRTVYVIGRAIEANLNGTKVYTRVSNVAYGATTTVTVANAVLTAQLTAVSYGIINADATKNSLPLLGSAHISAILGVPDTSKSLSTIYQAATDVVIMCSVSSNAGTTAIAGYVGPNNPPIYIAGWMTALINDFAYVCFVCRKGEYFKCQYSGAAPTTTYFSVIPLGS